MALSIERQQVLLNAQTAAARKVFEAVPIQEPFTSQAINHALNRTTRSTMDFRILQGCLNTLKDAGLVVEPMQGCFMRASVREKSTMFKSTDYADPKQAQKKPASVEMLTELAARARKLADDLDAAASVINEEHETNAANLATLAQLQTLFKRLS